MSYTYQDLWAHGKLVSKGYRECASRYEIIKRFCSTTFKRGFSVCDIGANMCYFGIRLVEDFNCKVLAFEFHHFLMRSAHLSMSGASNNIVLIDRKINLNDLRVFRGFFRFDLVLALSVLHHVKENQVEWETSLKKIGRYVIFEYAGKDSKRAEEKPDHGYKGEGTIIGYGDSHLDDEHKREIVVMDGGMGWAARILVAQFTRLLPYHSRSYVLTLITQTRLPHLR